MTDAEIVIPQFGHYVFFASTVGADFFDTSQRHQSSEKAEVQPRSNLRGCDMKLMQKHQKTAVHQVSTWGSKTESISIHLHVKMSNFTPEINMYKDSFGLYS